MTRPFFVHCGLHKTASTTLQRALSGHAGALEDQGLFLPKLGRVRGAHHGLAYALASPRKFRANTEMMDGLVQTGQANPDHAFAVSSEDFETILRHKKALNRLIRTIGRANAEPVFVIYLRHQVSYFESLYLQLLRMGLGKPVLALCDEVVETGQFTWRKWVFQFDYAAMTSTLNELGARVIYRNYHTLEGGNPLLDFLTVTGHQNAVRTDGLPDANKARSDRNLFRYVCNALSLEEEHHDHAQQLEQGIGGARPRLSASARNRLVKRFEDGNADMRAQWGFDLNTYAPDVKRQKSAPQMDLLFSAKTAELVKVALTQERFEPAPVQDHLASTWS